MPGRYFLSKLLVMQCILALSSAITTSSKSIGIAATKPLVILNNVAPGWCDTELFRHENAGTGRNIAMKLIGRSSEEGSRTLVHGIVAGKESHGQYLSECQVKGMLPWLESEEGRRATGRVWAEVMERLERVSPGVTGHI